MDLKYSCLCWNLRAVIMKFLSFYRCWFVATQKVLFSTAGKQTTGGFLKKKVMLTHATNLIYDGLCWVSGALWLITNL